MSGFKYEPYKPEDGKRSAHYEPLPDIGDWKFESDFMGNQFRYTNQKYPACIAWIRRYERGEGYRQEWRILHPESGSYSYGANGKTREFKSPERAIKALEADFDPIDHA